MQIVLYFVGGIVLFYLAFTLLLTYIVQQVPRNPVEDEPDWGKTLDTQIPSIDKSVLEVWRIDPDGPSRGTVVLAHGWGRNRDRMVSRARFFGRWGFTAVIHSARDHGRSSPRRFMNAAKFAEDIEFMKTRIAEVESKENPTKSQQNSLEKTKEKLTTLLEKKQNQINDAIDAANKERQATDDVEKEMLTMFTDPRLRKRYFAIVDMEELEENEFNLNIPRYVDTFEPEEEIDIAAVQQDIDRIEKELAETQEKMRDYLKELGF